MSSLYKFKLFLVWLVRTLSLTLANNIILRRTFSWIFCSLLSNKGLNDHDFVTVRTFDFCIVDPEFCISALRVVSWNSRDNNGSGLQFKNFNGTLLQSYARCGHNTGNKLVNFWINFMRAFHWCGLPSKRLKMEALNCMDHLMEEMIQI